MGESNIRGGEPTFRYQAAYHNYWGAGSQTAQFKTTWFGSVGYLTEVGVSISTRQGRIASPDYRFNPELITYGERLNETVATPFTGKESYFWGGLALKARFYNVFLQGQFRDSVHTLGGFALGRIGVEQIDMKIHWRCCVLGWFGIFSHRSVYPTLSLLSPCCDLAGPLVDLRSKLAAGIPLPALSLLRKHHSPL